MTRRRVVAWAAVSALLAGGPPLTRWAAYPADRGDCHRLELVIALGNATGFELAAYDKGCR